VAQDSVVVKVVIKTDKDLEKLIVLVGDRAPTIEEALSAARYLICESAPRQMKRDNAECDAHAGLYWLKKAGVSVPIFSSWGFKVAEEIRDWFEKYQKEVTTAQA